MKRMIRVGVIGVVALAAVGCTDPTTEDETTREDGEVVEGGDVGAFALQLGDCFDSDAVGEVESLPVVPCAEEHTGEVFHLFDMPDGDYPGRAAVDEAAEEGCLAAFSDYVGTDFESSRFTIGWLFPTQETWDAIDDREIVCNLFDLAGERLTGSARGSGE